MKKIRVSRKLKILGSINALLLFVSCLGLSVLTNSRPKMLNAIDVYAPFGETSNNNLKVSVRYDDFTYMPLYDEEGELYSSFNYINFGFRIEFEKVNTTQYAVYFALRNVNEYKFNFMNIGNSVTGLRYKSFSQTQYNSGYLPIGQDLANVPFYIGYEFNNMTGILSFYLRNYLDNQMVFNYLLSSYQLSDVERVGNYTGIGGSGNFYRLMNVDDYFNSVDSDYWYTKGFNDGINQIRNNPNDYDLYSVEQYLDYGASQYNLGLENGANQLSIYQFITTIFRAPVDMFKGSFNWTLPLGDGHSIDMLPFMTFILTIGIALAVVKLILGKGK